MKNSILAEAELYIHTEFTDASVITSVHTQSCNNGISKLILQLTDFGMSSDEYTYKNVCNELLPFFNFKNH